MRIILRGIRTILFLSLFITSTVFIAQEDDTIDIVGSRIVTDALSAIYEASESEADLNINPAGTTSGFNTFCTDNADMTGANRPISLEEEATCIQNNVAYSEYLIGYDVIAIITHPDLAMIDCLAVFDINQVFSLSSQLTNWDQISFGAVSDEIITYLPPDSTSSYALLDSLVEGLALRTSFTLDDDAAIIEAVSTTPGAVGLVRLGALAEDAAVHVTQLQNASIGQCYPPNAETIQDRLYPGAARLFLYVNNASTVKAGLDDLLTFAIGGDASEAITESGFIAPTNEITARNLAILAGDEDAGRQFSLEVSTFEIPPSVIGTVNIGGSANLFNYLQLATGSFNQEYPGVTFSTDLEGETAGFRRLCNGEISIMASSRDLPATEAENCAANNIETATFELGSQSVVVLANAADDYLECLTPEQLITIWGAPTGEAITNWNQVDAGFPDAPMILVAPPNGEIFTDLLLTPAEGAVIPLRQDSAEQNPDALYRGAAVANVPGGMSFMSWSQYQNVLENGQEGIQAVAVDAGAGCVTPSLETILDGSYPYIRSAKLIVNQSALSRVEIQSVLWYMFSDENYTLLSNSGLIGVNFGALPTVRDELQGLYSEAIASQTAPSFPEIAPPLDEPEGEATAEPEAEATAEPEATAETE